ncbi:hypothetical protein QYF48_23970, partial [Brevibacillus agri]|uniref:hypothetical protein n=1 Tax=Brevibacillus agri TaxID=51101 RepID=UPI0025B63DCB
NHGPFFYLGVALDITICPIKKMIQLETALAAKLGQNRLAEAKATQEQKQGGSTHRKRPVRRGGDIASALPQVLLHAGAKASVQACAYRPSPKLANSPKPNRKRPQTGLKSTNVFIIYRGTDCCIKQMSKAV